MKAIMLMFDTLCRRFLPPYGCDWTVAPNFKRLAERTAIFDNCYVGSMPCMPARRDLHTARYNFLHRSWGPLEPFDDSMPEMLKTAGVYTHLASDHYHYWEDGGCNYHNRYNSWEFERGQEGDKWKGEVADPEQTTNFQAGRWSRYDEVNRKYMPTPAEHFQTRTLDRGCEFINTNAEADNWFLHIECFDPHEPFFTHEEFKKLYPHIWDGPHLDWPTYGRATETIEQIEHLRYEYAALLSMCDRSLGRVLDLMDEKGLWDDTMLIVNTDHGFLLGEHEMMAKCHMPFYQEVAHAPLFIWDPRSRVAGERRASLVQMSDLSATLLELFGVELTADMTGRPLRQTIADDTPVHEAVLFGIHGGQVNVTDGRYVYMRGATSADNQPLFNYTHMPTHMNRRFSVKEMSGMTWHEGFSFTKGCPVMKIPSSRGLPNDQEATLLWDVSADYDQKAPLSDPDVEQRMIGLMVDLMKQHDAPPEQFERLGLTEYATAEAASATK